MRYPATTGPVPQPAPGHGRPTLGGRWVNLILFFLLCVSGHLDAQPWSGIIDPSRAIDWSNVGIPGGIPTNRTQCGSTIAAYAGAPDTINNALAACSPNQYVLLGPGTFSLSSGITFGHHSNLTLRGAGANQTFIVFTGSGACGGMSADACADSSDLNWCCGGSSPSNTANWTATSYAKGQTQITMDNVSNLVVGAPLILDQCDDGLAGSACTGTPVDTGNIWVCGDSSSSNPAYKCSDDLGGTGGASGSQRTGRNQMQIVTVTAIDGNLVTFSPGLYMPNWAAAKNPGAWWATSPIYGDGIENLSMDHSSSDAQAGTIFFNCLGCWVSGIRDVNSDRSHVWLLASPRGVVRENYFYGAKNAQSQGNGIEAYSSSDSLFENNIFQHVTSPQMVNGACSGCVISYNYSIDDFETVSPTLLYNSLTINAAGTDNILAEGNVGASYRADLYHGTHNLNTVFRNEFNGWELGKTDGLLPVFLDPYARYFNVIGNVLGKSGIQTTYAVTPSGGSPPAIYMIGTGTDFVALSGDPLSVSSLMRWGNYDTLNAAVQWNASEVPSGLSQYANPVPSNHSLPPSFYLSTMASWWGSMPWPAVGPDVNAYSYGNPAELCYDNSPIDGNYGANSVLLFNANTCTAFALQYAKAAPPNDLTATPISTSQINLSWTAPTSSGGVANYMVQRCQGAGCTNFAHLASPTGTTYSDTGLPPGNTYSYRVQAFHTVGTLSLLSNRASATTQTPPTAPSNLTATAISASQINLSWTASTSSVGLSNYVVQRCQGVGCTTFAQIATPAGVTFSDTGLSFNTSYSYQVEAVDTAGNLSPFSNLAAATTQTPPTAPSNLAATSIGGQINLSWTASTSSVVLANYVVQRCQGPGCTNFAQIATSTGTTYSDPGLAAGSYSYIVQATDVAGNLSPSSNVATGVIPHVSLSWIASTDSARVTAYLVERCQGANCSTFAQIASVPGTAFNDTSVIGNTNYAYRVRDTDAVGNLSAYSNLATATTLQFIGYVQGNYATPQTPQTMVNVTFNAAQVAGDLNVVVVGWKDSTATVNAVTDGSGNMYTLAVGPTVQMGIASQSIYYAKNITPAAAGGNTVTVTFSNAAVYPDIRILEYNGADPNNPVDGTAANTGNSATSSSGSLTTTNATDLLFGANLVQTFTTGPGSGFTAELVTSPAGDIAEDQMVTARGSYIATASVSPSGQWIMQMVAFRAASGSTTPPTAPSNLTATAASTSQINLSWTASTSTVGLANYVVQRCQGAGCTNFAQIAAPAGTGYSDTGLTSGISYSYQVQAIDTAGNLSVFSNVASATTPGPPTAPGNLTATAASTSQINLSWTASTSTVGLANYVVQRCQGAGCTNFAPIAAPAGTTYSDTSLTFGTSYSYQVQAIDTAGNLSVFSNVASATTPGPPTAPGNLTATAASTSQINLSWTASTSTVGLRNYIVQRCQGAGCTNFAQIASPVGTTYSDTSLTSGTSYSYQVQAVDTAGNLSVFSNVASATTQAPPTAPGNLTATAASTSQINLSWTASTSTVGLRNYIVQRCQGAGCTNFASIASPVGTTYSDTSLTSGTSYSYQVQAVDTAGNLSAFSNVASATTQAPPTAPSNLTATAASTSQINLSWTASTSTVGLRNYIVQRCQGAGCTNFAQIASPTGTTYSDTGLTSGTSYSYQVQAIDTAGNLSAFSNVASATTQASPSAPGNLTATAASTSQINLSWTASTSTVGLRNYIVQRCHGAACTNFASIASPAGTTYSDTGLTSSTSYSYQVQAIDTAGNLSPYSNVASATTPPFIGYVQGNYATPQTPQTTVNVTFTAAQVAGDLNVVVVGWSDSTAVVSAVNDGSGNAYTLAVGPTVQTGIASQSIYYAKNITAAAAGGNTVTVTFSSAAVYPDIRILEYNGADPNNPVDGTAANTGNSATSSSGSLTTTNATDLLFGANLVQTFTTGPGSGFTAELLTSPAGDIAEDQMVTASGSYGASAPLGVAGPWIMQMVAFRAASGSTTPPTAPGNVTATATSVSQINLSWAASTSTVGLRNYIVQRCQGAGCTNFAQIASPTGTTYSDTGLTSGSSYSYQVQAVDTAGNLSAFSNVASATTQASPTAPSNLTATATSTSQINLSWTASTSTVGLANYIVQRCQGAACTNFAQIASPTGTTYSDTSLTSGNSYSYQVQAVDTAGNLSAFSNVASATTQASPTAPGNLTATATSTSQINLSWTASTSTVGLRNYIVQRCQGAACTNFASIASPTGTTYSDTGLTSGTSYSYQVQAVDTAGNLSAFSNVASATTQASPTAPSNLTATAASTSQINLSWTASTSTVGLRNYIVQRCQGAACTNFAQIASPTGTTYGDTGLTSGASYSYQVQAVDTAGNLSAFSNVASATTQASPTAPGNLTATAASTSQINLSWTASTSTVGLRNYIVQRCQGAGCTNFAPIASPTGTTYSDTGLTSGTSYSYQVQAVDTAGNLSAFSNVASATTQASPTAPSNLTATAASTSQINLSWTASTSTVGLRNYIVQRCQGAGCANFAPIASPTGISYSDTGLTSGTSYSYQVQAIDIAGNLSPYSNVASATTLTLFKFPLLAK